MGWCSTARCSIYQTRCRRTQAVETGSELLDPTEDEMPEDSSDINVNGGQHISQIKKQVTGEESRFAKPGPKFRMHNQ